MKNKTNFVLQKNKKKADKIRKNKNEKKGRDEKCDLPGSQ